jgi:hypothetical protein
MLMRLEFKAKITTETPTLILVLDYNHSEVAKFLVKEGANVFARCLEEGQYTSPFFDVLLPSEFLTSWMSSHPVTRDQLHFE